jgi:hypothetical protein
LGPAHDARPHFGEKSLILIREHFKQVVGHYCTQYGIAQVFEPLVAYTAAIIQFKGLRLMPEGKFIQKNIPGVKPENIF